jgi:hypothetical protein
MLHFDGTRLAFRCGTGGGGYCGYLRCCTCLNIDHKLLVSAFFLLVLRYFSSKPISSVLVVVGRSVFPGASFFVISVIVTAILFAVVVFVTAWYFSFLKIQIFFGSTKFHNASVPCQCRFFRGTISTQRNRFTINRDRSPEPSTNLIYPTITHRIF